MRIKTILPILTLMLCIGSSASAGQLKPSASVVDFGHMEEGPVAERVVQLTNTGSEVVTIANVTTS